MARWLPWVMLAFGGAAGTVARYGLSLVVQKLHGTPWPAGTLAVNALGCLIFGFVWGVLSQRMDPPSPLWSMTLLVGFCGAFTTFSTFAFEVHRVSGDFSVGHALGYLALSNAAGLLMVWVGFAQLARRVAAG
ncbi:MAG: fluoride efflux transporter CrcB [Planctomycetota bacterium]